MHFDPNNSSKISSSFPANGATPSPTTPAVNSTVATIRDQAMQQLQESLTSDEAELIAKFKNLSFYKNGWFNEAELLKHLNECKQYPLDWKSCAAILKAIGHVASLHSVWSPEIQALFVHYFLAYKKQLPKDIDLAEQKDVYRAVGGICLNHLTLPVDVSFDEALFSFLDLFPESPPRGRDLLGIALRRLGSLSLRQVVEDPSVTMQEWSYYCRGMAKAYCSQSFSFEKELTEHQLIESERTLNGDFESLLTKGKKFNLDHTAFVNACYLFHTLEGYAGLTAGKWLFDKWCKMPFHPQAHAAMFVLFENLETPFFFVKWDTDKVDLMRLYAWITENVPDVKIASLSKIYNDIFKVCGTAVGFGDVYIQAQVLSNHVKIKLIARLLERPDQIPSYLSTQVFFPFCSVYNVRPGSYLPLKTIQMMTRLTGVLPASFFELLCKGVRQSKPKELKCNFPRFLNQSPNEVRALFIEVCRVLKTHTQGSQKEVLEVVDTLSGILSFEDQSLYSELLVGETYQAIESILEDLLRRPFELEENLEVLKLIKQIHKSEARSFFGKFLKKHLDHVNDDCYAVGSAVIISCLMLKVSSPADIGKMATLLQCLVERAQVYVRQEELEPLLIEMKRSKYPFRFSQTLLQSLVDRLCVSSSLSILEKLALLAHFQTSGPLNEYDRQLMLQGASLLSKTANAELFFQHVERHAVENSGIVFFEALGELAECAKIPTLTQEIGELLLNVFNLQVTSPITLRTFNKSLASILIGFGKTVESQSAAFENQKLSIDITAICKSIIDISGEYTEEEKTAWLIAFGKLAQCGLTPKFNDFDEDKIFILIELIENALKKSNDLNKFKSLLAGAHEMVKRGWFKDYPLNILAKIRREAQQKLRPVQSVISREYTGKMGFAKTPTKKN